MKNLGIAKLKANRFVEFQEGDNFDIIDHGEHWVEVKTSMFFNKKMVEIKLNESDYEQSNRYKLSQFIKAQPYKAIELSVAIGHQATYLSSTASKSRFESRGDISDAQLHKIYNEVNNKVLELNTPNQETIDAMNDLKKEADKALDDIISDLKEDGCDIKKTKSIQVSKNAVWFTIFLITVLIVSLLATLIYLA